MDSNISTTPQRRAAETKRLLRAYRATGDRRARDRIVFIYAPLVRYVAYKKIRELPANCEVDELVSAGLVALIECVDRWDPERGVAFEQYAWTRLQGAMVDELRRQDWVPRRVRRDERLMGAAQQRSQARLGRAPSHDELAEQMGIAPERLVRLRADLARSEVMSLDAPVESADDEEIARISTVAAVGDDPLFSLLRSEDRAAVRRGFAALTPREREVAALIYIRGLSQRDAGRHLGITESRVSQLHTSLRKTLRRVIVETSEATAAAVL